MRIRSAWFWVGLLAAVFLYMALASVLGLNILSHSPYDSYTLQAMSWREGRVDLGQDYSYLEIARYEGRFFVSFPPFPTVPMLLLSFIFGAETPSMLVTFLCYVAAYCGAYLLCARYLGEGMRPALLSVFLVCGCNMMEFALFGGVWNMAQTMGFALAVWAFLLCGARRSAAQYIGFVCIACAVGCRPFYALYAPFLTVYVFLNVKSEAEGQWSAALKRFLPMLIAPAAIAVLYCVYNYIRFDDIFEFGHNYLPEFTAAENGQFSTAYMADNLRNILRMPWFEDGKLLFPLSSGFAFWLCNPMYVVFAVQVVLSAVRRRISLVDALLFAALAANFLLLLMHKSFGGVQFGCRYLCDLLPAMFFFIASRCKKEDIKWQAPIALFAVSFNVYGAYTFQKLYQSVWH